jgi:cell division protein FtsB
MQTVADKTSLKAQLDDLAAENSRLKAKTKELTDEVARLKPSQPRPRSLPGCIA